MTCAFCGIWIGACLGKAGLSAKRKVYRDKAVRKRQENIDLLPALFTNTSPCFVAIEVPHLQPRQRIIAAAIIWNRVAVSVGAA